MMFKLNKSAARSRFLVTCALFVGFSGASFAQAVVFDPKVPLEPSMGAQAAVDVFMDRVKRCFAVARDASPIDATGFLIIGDDRIDYDAPLTKQKWRHRAEDVSVLVRTDVGYDGQTTLICRVEAIRDFSLEQRLEIDRQFDGWLDLELEAGRMEPLQYPFDTRESDRRTIAVSTGGNVRRCQLGVYYTYTRFGDDYEVDIMMTETRDHSCDLEVMEFGEFQ